MRKFAVAFLLVSAAFMMQCSSSFHPEAQTTGPQGPAGQAATVTVGQTTTGAPGSAAQVTNSGTSSAAVLNFTIPGSFPPLPSPLVAGQTASINVVSSTSPLALASEPGAPQITVTITQPQLVSLIINADVTASSDICYIGAFDVANQTDPFNWNSSTAGYAAIYTGVAQSATVQKTMYAIMKPGTYVIQLQYAIEPSVVNGEFTCMFTNSHISMQSYGAGSTMQSSGTF